MSLDLFRIYDGVDVSSPDLSSNAYVLQGPGAPGTTQLANEAPVGSIWMDTTAEGDKNQLWWKHTAGTGVDKWTQGASVPFVQALAAGITWREPVVVADLTATTVPSSNVVDGVTVNTGERVLFAGLTSGANVYIWNGTAFVQDTNTATDGDSLFVQGGTSADQQWTYSGTQWFQMGGSTNAEQDNVRAFIGKDAAGASMPSYVSSDVVVNGVDLRLGISALDNVLGTLTFGSTNVISNIDKGTINIVGSVLSTYDVTSALNALDSTYGSGTITNTSGYAVNANLQWGAGGTLTITDAINALNDRAGNMTFTNVTSGYTLVNAPTMTATSALDALNTVIGSLGNSTSYTTGGYLSTAAISGNTIQQNFDAVNVELGALARQDLAQTGSANSGVTTPLEAVGTQLTPSEATEIIWQVQVKDGAGKRQAFMVHCMTDGTAIDHSVYAVVRTGGNLGGNIGFDVQINAGKIEASLTPSAGAGALTYTIKRVSYSYLA